MDKRDGTAWLLSFLAILVDRAGGEIVIENLSAASGQNLRLGYDLDRGGDRVTLMVRSETEGEGEK